ncbi:MAG: sulfotransferase [Actinobacteria bacterium]|nr:sulfotransferase [Actinomycetota bacterium]
MSRSGPAEVRFLIGGQARSGTTLVQRLCCELAPVWVPPETHFWFSAEALSNQFGFPLRGEDRLSAAEWIARDLAERGIELRVADLTERMAGHNRRIGLWTIFESVVAALSPSSRQVLGEKTPQHLFWWEHLSNAVPGLRFVVIVRDPRAVLRSHRSVAWGETDAYALAERWLAYQRAAADAHRLLGPDRVLVLRYEDVVLDAEGARSQIARLLEVPDGVRPLTPEVLGSHPLFPARETWKSRALEPIEADTRSAEGDVPVTDVGIIDAICGSLMETLGYQTGAAGEVAPPEGVSRDRVAAFRRWHAAVLDSVDLAVY